MTINTRNNFTESIKRKIAARAGNRCSNPECRAPTSGPQVTPDKALNIGVAAHITAAAPGGPRYEPKLTSDERGSINNSIWLCENCAKLVDNDEVRYSVKILRNWKNIAEDEALNQIGRPQSQNTSVSLIKDNWVNLSYIEQAEIAQELRKQGFELKWATANSESELVDLKGWEVVINEQPDGTKMRFKIRDHEAVGGYLILLKKKEE